MNPVTPETMGELDWLAFRYVVGELDTDEAASFESRLEADTTACEALVEAMRLVEILYQTECRPLPSRPSEPGGAG